MSSVVELKNGNKVNIRAKCINPDCGLLIISGDDNTSENEETITPDQMENPDDLQLIPSVLCANCRS